MHKLNFNTVSKIKSDAAIKYEGIYSDLLNSAN